MAVAAPRRRADGDEDRLGALHAFGQIGGEGEPAGRDVARDELVEARLEDRHDAPLQRVDLGLILVDADDVMAEVRKAGSGNQADIAGSDHRDAHSQGPGW